MPNEPSDVFKYIAIGNDDECWSWLGSWGGRSIAQGRRPYFMAAGRRQIAYRWVYELMSGVSLTVDQLILHSCDNGNWPIGCCNYHHLRIGTHAENNDDATLRQRVGLPKTVVRAILTLINQGKTHDEIASLYGIARSTVSAIAARNRRIDSANPNGELEC